MCNLLLTFITHLRTLLAEIQVSLTLERDKMNVGMRDLHSENSHAYPLARHCCLDGKSYFACKRPKTFVNVLIQIEDIVILNVLWDYKGMTLRQWIDIKKSVELVILRYLV